MSFPWNARKSLNISTLNVTTQRRKNAIYKMGFIKVLNNIFMRCKSS